MTSVLYDGSCPLCTREIAMYRRLEGAASIEWLDVSKIPEEDIPLGLSREDALSRFHVVRSDGSAVIGAAAFVELWKAFPKLQFLTRFTDRAPAQAILELMYRLFLYARPALQWVFSIGRKETHE